MRADSTTELSRGLDRAQSQVRAFAKVVRNGLPLWLPGWLRRPSAHRPLAKRRRRTRFDALCEQVRNRHVATNRGRRRHEKLTVNIKKIRRRVARELAKGESHATQ